MAQDLEKLLVQVSADIKNFDNAMKKASGLVDKRTREIEARFLKMNKKLDTIGRSAANSLIAPLSGVGAALGVSEVLQYADAWTRAKNSLAVAGLNGEKQARVLQQLYDLSQANASPLEATVALYGKATQAGANLGASQADLLKLTDAVGLSLRVTGQGAGEASGALQQLGQLLSGNKVQAEEYGSLVDGLYPLLQAAATGSERWGGSVAKLTSDVKSGNVSVAEFFRSILNGTESLRGRADAAAQTIDQALTKIQNAFTRYIGQTDSSLGASQRLVSGMNALADNFDQTADVALQLASVIAGALAGRAMGAMLAAIPNGITAIVTLTTALRAGTGVAAAFSASLGPIGLLLGAAAAAAVLFTSTTTAAEDAAKTHAQAINELNYQIQTTDYANKEAVDSTRQKIATDIEAAQTALTRAKAERELAAAMARDEIDPGMSLLPAPKPNDVAGTVADNVMVKDRQALIAELEKQLVDYKKKQAEFDDYTSGRKKPNRDEVKAPTAVASGGEGKSKGRKDSDLESYARMTEKIARRTESINAETAAQAGLNPLVDDYGYSVEKAAAQHDLLTAAQDAGKKITPELRAEIDRLANAYARSTVESAKLREKQDEMRQSAAEARAFNKDLTRGIVDGFTSGAKAADVFADSLKKIGDRLLDLAFDGLFDSKGGGAILGTTFRLGIRQ